MRTSYSPNGFFQRQLIGAALLAATATGCSGSDDGAGNNQDINDIGGENGGGASNGATQGSGGSGGSANFGSNGSECAKADVSARRAVPTVWLMVDGSGSMGVQMETSGTESRWSVLRDALLADGSGLIATLQSTVSFGLFVYDGGFSPPGIKTPACPRVVAVEPALDNLDAIRSAYPMKQMGASTPTHYALLELEKRVEEAGELDNAYVVLATDGKPNKCDFHDGVQETAATSSQAVETVSSLASMGIKTFAISMAGENAALNEHLELVATAGATGEGVFTPTTRADLAAVLGKIIGKTVNCDIKLEGTITPGYECDGEVQLNGTLLECNGPDGFVVKDDLKTLELQGSACTTLKNDANATIKATFPCEGVTVE